MLPSQRDAVILGILQQRQIITVEEIRTQCNCSLATARRDLGRLENQGLLRRTHGGATPIRTPTYESPNPAILSAMEARLALLDRSDALIVTPNSAEGTRVLVERARRAGVPIVAEGSNYPGARTVVLIDNYQAGVELGRWLGQYAEKHLPDQAKVLEVLHPTPNTETRARGFSDGLREALDEVRVVLRVDEQELRAPARTIVADALGVHPDINVIFAINDDTAMGAVEAYRSAGLDINRLTLVWFGLECDETLNLLETGGPFKACVAMFPEIVGRACVDAAVRVWKKEPLPDCIITPWAVVTPGTLERYYVKDLATDDWTINWTAVQHLPTANKGYNLLRGNPNHSPPARIGWVQIFSSHDWYLNIHRAMQKRSHELDIHLEVLDASQDLALEIDALKRTIGQAAARMVEAGDTVIIDAGITTKYLAQALRGQRDITVITNSLLVLSELGQEPGLSLVSSGGSVRSESLSLIGPAAESTFHNLRVDKTFITGTGISADFGLSNTNNQETGVKQAMVKAGHKVILLADNPKIGLDSLVKIVPLEAIHSLVTDAGISAHDRQTLMQHGLDVVIADKDFV
jgi:DeoR/GlpR family transcriptional regulator of sugar metabolism